MKWLKNLFFWFVLPVASLIIMLILFGRQMVFGYLSPPDSFVLADAPKAPDFDNEYFWVAYPDKSDTSDLVPVGIDTSGDIANKDIDVFFVHSTGFVGPGGWNSTMKIGHSQGSAHALRLLEQRVDNTELVNQLVAAYLVGYWLPKDKFTRGFEQIEPCENATQTGCIVSYDVYGQGGELDVNVPHWYKTGWEVNRQADDTVKPTVCINPLSWQSNLNQIPKKQHIGAMPVDFKRTPVNMLLANNPGFIFQELPELTNELTWAQCMEDGRLEIMQQMDSPFSNHLDQPSKSYHVLDFSLFYGNIRQNAIQRVNHFMATNSVSPSESQYQGI